MPPNGKRVVNRLTHQPTGPTPGRATHSISRWAVFAISWLLLSLMAGLWSVATPISGAPDEPAHIIKAASVARGQFIGTTTQGGQSVEVPAYIAFTPALTCFAFQPKKNANCAPPETGSADGLVFSTTSAGLYNPTYYLLVGWPTLLFDDNTGIYAVRIVSGILSSLFLAIAVMMISTWRRRTLPIAGLAIAATPMVFFLNGVVNPNSLEASATLGALVGVLSIVLHPQRSRVIERSVVVLISAAIAVNTRGISPLWVGIAVLVPFVLVPWSQTRTITRSAPVRIAVIGIAVATVAAFVWIALSNSLGAGLTGPDKTALEPGVGISPIHGFVQIFAGTFDYGQGLVGIFGWLDTPAPAAVFFVWSLFIGALVLAAVTFLKGRPLVFVLIITGGLVLFPAIIQALYVTGGGIIWQGRYALALYVCLAVGIAAVLANRMPQFDQSVGNRFIGLVLAAWFAGQVYAFITALKRYSVGAAGAEGASWPRVFLNPEWNPPGGTVYITILSIVVFATGAVLLSWLAKSQDGGAFDVN